MPVRSTVQSALGLATGHRIEHDELAEGQVGIFGFGLKKAIRALPGAVQKMQG